MLSNQIPGLQAHFDWKGQPVRVYRKTQGFSVTWGSDTVYSFDLTGRLLWVYAHQWGYQRGLSHQILAKWRNSAGRQRRFLGDSERQIMLERVFADLHQWQAIAPDSVQNLFQQLKSPETLAAEGVQFQSLYRPISILPPDQYGAIVLQAAEGCSYNQCSFCNFYKNRRFRIKSLAEFNTHIGAVQTWLGEGSQWRRTLFLADGDALMIPQKRLLKMMTLGQAAFPGRKWYSFMDAFRPGVKSQADYEALAAVGLHRVYVGLETGNGELLKWLDKPGTPATMLSEIQCIKAAGLQVGLIFMLGVGGERFAAAHVQQSLDLICQLPLDADDILYFSIFIEHPDQPYAIKARADKVRALDQVAMMAQYQQFREGLSKMASKPRSALYHLNEYVY